MRYSFRTTTLAAALAASAVAACDTDEILEVADPDVARPDALADTLALPVYLAGAYSDFQVAYNGNNGLNQVNGVGLLTDELIQTESFPTRFEVDTRNMTRTNGTLTQLYLDLQRARASAERAARKYVELERPNASGRWESMNLAGFSYIFAGENYCSGTAFSTLNDDFTIDYGEPLTTQQVFQAAVAKFDSVLAGTGVTAAQQNLARIGRGRALLNLGQFAQAGQAVAGVPATYQFILAHSENSARQNNGVWNLTTSQGRFGVSDAEADEGLPFIAASDARVASRRRSVNGGNGFDGGPMQEQLKYPARTTNITLADGVEAELIRAEAALQANNATDFLAILNGLRSNAALLTLRGITGTLAPLTDPGSATARQNLLFRERAFWLYLTAHRLGDLRRLVRQYSRAATSVYPSGNYSSNGRNSVYGDDLNFPIPIEEDNNPNIAGTPQSTDASLKGCLSRGA
jgi:hypothetical protein